MGVGHVDAMSDLTKRCKHEKGCAQHWCTGGLGLFCCVSSACLAQRNSFDKQGHNRVGECDVARRKHGAYNIYVCGADVVDCLRAVDMGVGHFTEMPGGCWQGGKQTNGLVSRAARCEHDSLVYHGKVGYERASDNESCRIWIHQRHIARG